MTTPVLATKLFAPVRRPLLVPRPGLLTRLDAALDAGHRLTLVSAPAGFGKTTVLGDWIAHLARQPSAPRVGWLSLDAGDNDLARFLAHVVAALDSVGLGVDPALLESLDATSGPAVLTELVNAVSRFGAHEPRQRWVLVLDDYHAVTAAEVHEAVTFLVERLPPLLHLVLATRSDPPLPLPRLRTRGQLVEVRAAELRFTPTEAGELLARAGESDLTPTEVAALEERTEGWIAGLQLAALSLRELTDPEERAAFITGFTGSNRFVIDYLADEVLARQPDDVRDFLLRTAVLDRLTGPLCDAITGRADGTRMLEDLERANLFLVPLDPNRAWYRYHHLFADVLQARLQAETPELVPALHRRASAWFSSRGLVEDAFRHALAGADFERAARLLEEALTDLRRTRQDRVLMTWVGALPEEVVRRRPVLSILAGWTSLLAGDLEGLEVRLDAAEAALAAGALDPDLASSWADTEDLRTAPATVAVYRAALAQARGDVAATVRHARRAVELARPEDHVVRGAGAGYLGLAAWAAGDVDEALVTFSEAVRSLHAAGNLVDELDSTVVLADMWIASGRPSRARHLCDVALRTAAAGGPHVRAAADLHVCLAELDRELDDLDGAEAHLETARALRERTSITENRHRWFVATSQVRWARGDHRGAVALLDEAAAIYRPGFYPDVRPVAAMKARVHIAAGELSAAAAWAEGREVGVDDDPDYLREYEHLTLARLLLAQHRTGEPGHPADGASLTALRALLERMQAAATRTGRAGSVLEIRLLQALTLQATGRQGVAHAVLARAVQEAPEPESHVRLYLDEGAPMLDLLRHAANAAPQDAAPPDASGDVVRRCARRLVERARTSGAETSPTSLVDPLSRRELDVLRLLATELTGPEIARELYVTLNTLRSHTKHIFTKLDVTTRAAAVRRARERGLLKPAGEPA